MAALILARPRVGVSSGHAHPCQVHLLQSGRPGWPIGLGCGLAARRRLARPWRRNTKAPGGAIARALRWSGAGQAAPGRRAPLSLGARKVGRAHRWPGQGARRRALDNERRLPFEAAPAGGLQAEPPTLALASRKRRVSYARAGDLARKSNRLRDLSRV